ncbi:hypothetical protein [Vibrio harveyi]|uniref:hypothetical protein n=1 Tax=Vibrio harveyi TaxID=669 RepID=UPI0009386988|nr:hypothetical protein [Vibrio harveyi]APP06741.1 hypothetical protein BG259_16075 [Vibrio harveyi]
MPYQLTEQDLDVFFPDPNQVIADQVFMLAHYILPGGGNHAGFRVDYSTPEETYFLYLDERELPQNRLYIGGCLVGEQQSKTLTQPYLNFKSYFRPELNSRDWYMKGSGEWLQEGIKSTESKEEALTKWILWAKFLNILKTQYTFHSVMVDTEKFIYQEAKKKKQRKTVELYRESYLSLFKTLERQRKSKIYVVTDNIEGAQLKGFQQAIERSDTILDAKVLGEPPVPKSDFSSEYSCWLQFVDMQIYAASRFISPSGRNVLMDFEKYAYEIAEGQFKPPQTPEERLEYRKKEASYFILKDIFHHIRLSFTKNTHSPNYPKPFSSMVLVTAQEYLNFGDDVDVAIHEFCNRNTRKATMTFSLDKY